MMTQKEIDVMTKQGILSNSDAYHAICNLLAGE